MYYHIIEENDKIIIKDMKDFEPKHIFECGQCFRWNKESDGSYTGVALNRVLNVKKEGKDIIFSNTNRQDFDDLWYHYFDLGRDYTDVKKELAKDDIMKEAVTFGHGIRVLNQDPWEIIVSFITSSNRSIPIIKKSLEALCEKYGEEIETYKGRTYYSFPSPEVVNRLRVEAVQACHMGYRAKYIVNTAAIVADEQIDVYAMKNLSTEDARKELLLFSGVGPKVADCILLFAMEKSDAFPIDVWVKRVMEYFYLKEDTKLKAIQTYAQEKFDPYAGFAQQYLFYYARELGIGKKTINN